jgi:hypothetical protein
MELSVDSKLGVDWQIWKKKKKKEKDDFWV